ncbi:TPA_asm: P [Howea betacytorhabdovirus 1]|nr:TPA_asm: P [Howea betacytorhabdovirus 1]
MLRFFLNYPRLILFLFKALDIFEKVVDYIKNIVKMMNAAQTAFNQIRGMQAPDVSAFESLLEDMNQPNPPPLPTQEIQAVVRGENVPAGHQDSAMISMYPPVMERPPLEYLIHTFQNYLISFGIKPIPQWDDVVIRKYNEDPSFDGTTFLLPFAEGISVARQTAIDVNFSELLSSFNQSLKILQGVKGNFKQEVREIVELSESRLVKEIKGQSNSVKAAVSSSVTINTQCLEKLRFPKKAIEYPGLAERLNEALPATTIMDIVSNRIPMSSIQASQDAIKGLIAKLVAESAGSIPSTSSNR